MRMVAKMMVTVKDGHEATNNESNILVVFQLIRQVYEQEGREGRRKGEREEERGGRRNEW